jgi:hypothetical protein
MRSHAHPTPVFRRLVVSALPPPPLSRCAGRAFAPLSQVSASGLSGDGARAQVVELHPGFAPEVQSVEVGASSPLSGAFRLQFRGAATALLPFDASAAEVEAALEALPTVDRVVVTRTSLDTSVSAPSGAKFVDEGTEQSCVMERAVLSPCKSFKKKFRPLDHDNCHHTRLIFFIKKRGESTLGMYILVTAFGGVGERARERGAPLGGALPRPAARPRVLGRDLRVARGRAAPPDGLLRLRGALLREADPERQVVPGREGQSDAPPPPRPRQYPSSRTNHWVVRFNSLCRRATAARRFLASRRCLVRLQSPWV